MISEFHNSPGILRRSFDVLVQKQNQAVAILLSHWHNADGTVTWLDPGSEQGDREFRDRSSYSLKSSYMNLLALSGPLHFKVPRISRCQGTIGVSIVGCPMLILSGRAVQRPLICCHTQLMRAGHHSCQSVSRTCGDPLVANR
jgi:hypothetical protein